MRLTQSVAKEAGKVRNLGRLIDIPFLVTRDNRQFVSNRYTISQAFKHYTWKIIPALEEKIEERILSRLYEKMETQALKNELVQAYQRRRLNIQRLEGDSDASKEIQNAPYTAPAKKTYQHVVFDNINHTSANSVGYFALDSMDIYRKRYPKGFFGDISKFEFDRSNVFATMCTKESVAIVEILKNHTELKNNPFDAEKFCRTYPTDAEFRYAASNTRTHYALCRLLADDLREEIYKHRNLQFVQDKLWDSFLFDIIVNLMVIKLSTSLSYRMEFSNVEGRKKIAAALFTQILEKSDQEFTNFVTADDWLRHIDHLEFEIPRYFRSNSRFGLVIEKEENKIRKFLVKFGSNYSYKKALPESLSEGLFGNFYGADSGLLLYGDKGTGKSGAVGYATNWAYENDWIVFKVTDVYQWTMRPERPIVRHEESRLFLELEMAQQILEDFAESNKEKLLQIPVNLEIYGKYDAAGCHADEPAPVKNTYNSWRQSYFFDSDNFLIEDERKEVMNSQRFWKQRLDERLKEPKNLYELATYGVQHNDWSVNVVAEVLEQLYNLESHNVLVAVDGFNFFYRRSEYVNFRYESDKKLIGHIPPYHMALCRLFMRFDGHRIKNGFKLASISLKHFYKHVFTPEKINFPEGFCHEMKGLDLNTFRIAVQHYVNIGYLESEYGTENMIQHLFLETQGNLNLLAVIANNEYVRYAKWSERINGIEEPWIRYSPN